MLRAPLCDLLGISIPIIQGPIGPASSAELAAAVTNAGGLGSIATVTRPLDDVRAQLERLQELVNGPYAINHVVNLLDPAALTW